MSLYMHREAHKKNITYSQWVDESVQMHKKWDMCRKEVLDKIVPPRYKNEVRSTYLVDGLLSDAKFVAPEQSYWIEKQMSKTCGIPAPDFRPRDFVRGAPPSSKLNSLGKICGSRSNFVRQRRSAETSSVCSD